MVNQNLLSYSSLVLSFLYLANAYEESLLYYSKYNI